MKKIICLILCLTFVLFAFCACDESGKKEESGKSSVKVGATLKAPEKIADISDFEKLTVYYDMKTPQGERNEALSFYKSKDATVYYYGINDIANNFSMAYVTTVKDGQTKSYYEGWSEFEVIDGISDGQTDEEFHLTNLAFLGINPENDKTVIEYVKEKDETFDGKDCYVYTVKYEEFEGDEQFSDTTVWVDKESGFWLKSSFTIDGVEVSRTITAIEDSVSVIPGTLPVSINETDIYNTNQFRLTAKKIDTTNPNYAGVITFEAQNKSDSAIRVYTENFDVNGLVLAQKAFDETVEAGQTVEFECSIPDSSAELANIEIIKEITMRLHLETTDGLLIENIDAEKIVTDAPATFVQEIDKSGIEILNESGIKVVFQSFDFSDKGTPVFKAWVENKTYPYAVRVTVNLNKINGEEYDDFEKLYIPAYSEGYSAFYLYDDEITELNSIEITTEAFSGALFNSDRVTEETEPITIELK